jgi:hypothetical protein
MTMDSKVDMSTITNSSAFEKGSLGIQVVLSIVTLGFYSFYWMYKTADQLDRGTDADLNPILAIIPIYGQWIVSDAAGESVTDQSGVILFVLFLVFAPVSWFLIQSGINSIASQ